MYVTDLISVLFQYEMAAFFLTTTVLRLSYLLSQAQLGNFKKQALICGTDWLAEYNIQTVQVLSCEIIITYIFNPLRAHRLKYPWKIIAIYFCYRFASSVPYWLENFENKDC